MPKRDAMLALREVAHKRAAQYATPKMTARSAAPMTSAAKKICLVFEPKVCKNAENRVTGINTVARSPNNSGGVGMRRR
jgi:hypothetical protein